MWIVGEEAGYCVLVVVVVVGEGEDEVTSPDPRGTGRQKLRDTRKRRIRGVERIIIGGIRGLRRWLGVDFRDERRWEIIRWAVGGGGILVYEKHGIAYIASL